MGIFKVKDMEKEKIRGKIVQGRNIRLLLFSLVLLSEVFTLINPNFLSTYNLVSIGQSLAPYAVLSLGAIFPIALGCTDLSTGAVCIAAAVVSGKLYSMGMPLILVIPVMIIFGTLVGLLNGVLISRLKLPPFIVTLGTMMFIRGISALFANQPNVLFPTNSWYNKAFSVFNEIPIGFLWIVLVGVFTALFFRKTKTGRHVLAIGSSEKASVIAGLNVNRLKVISFTISGLLAGFAGILWSASFATVTVATGNGMELDAIAGAYIGGSAAAGGSVSAFGAVIGATLLVILRNGLNFILAKMDVPLNSTYVTYAITGIIVVFAVFLDKGKVKQNKKNLKRKNNISILNTYVLPGVSFVIAVLMIFSNTLIYSANKNGENKTIAILMKSENVAFWQAVKQGAYDAAEENGYKLIIRGAEAEDSSQLPMQRNLMNVMLSENPAGMGVAMIANGFTDLLEQAYDRGIPLVQYDSGLYAEDFKAIERSDKNPLCGCVKGDSYQNASLVAEELFAKLRDEIAMSSSYVVGVIQHENILDAAERANGFKDKFLELAGSDAATRGKCEVYVEVKPSPLNNAYKDGLEALFEKGAKSIFMTSEAVVNQVYDAVCASGNKYNGMNFVGYDSGSKALEWLNSDSEAKYLFGVSQNPYGLGRLTVETLIRIINKERIEELTVVSGVIYDRDNYAELLAKMVIS